MQLIGIAKKDYHLVGRLLINRDPHLAMELLSSFPRAREDDLSKIQRFFVFFCDYHHLQPDDLTGPLLPRCQIELQRLFICVILKLYVPYVFEMDLKNQQVRQGLTENIAKTIKQHPGNVSKMIRQAIVREKAYEDFREKMYSIIDTITHGQA